MFIGEYECRLDDKHRCTVPKPFRAVLTQQTLVLCNGLDGSVFLYTEETWRDFIAKLDQLGLGSLEKRSFARFVLSSAVSITLDKVGRFILPGSHLQTLHNDRDITLIGVGNRIELWQTEVWQKTKSGYEGQAEQLAETLNDLPLL